MALKRVAANENGMKHYVNPEHIEYVVESSSSGKFDVRFVSGATLTLSGLETRQLLPTGGFVGDVAGGD